MTRSAARLWLPLLTSVALAGACASGNPRARGGPAADWITHEEMVELQGVRNLYEVVERLRPRWLNVRAADRFVLDRGIVVYQDHMGSAEILKQFQPDMFYALRWLPGSVASATLPGLHPDRPVPGAIVLYTNERGGR